MVLVGFGGCSEFVERDAEMAVLTDVLAQAQQGEGGVVIVDAGPGVGRTALLGAFLRRATESGARVCAATASSAETEVEYGVAAQLFSTNGGLSAGLRFAHALDRRDEGRDSEVDGLFDALCQEFRRQPVVIAVDDAQFADAASLRLLLHLVRRLRAAPVMIVLTESTGPDTLSPSFQAELLRKPRCRRLGLLPLSRAGVAQVITPHVSPAEAPELAEDFHAVSGGNPLLVQALLADHRDAHRLDQVPVSAPRAVGPAFAKAALAWAYRDNPVLFDVACGFAVLGESATPALVACLVDRGADAVARVMTGLDTAGLLDGGDRKSVV